jgi:copper chaperone CopZ
MKKTYQAENISCNNCANMIKASLTDDFGEIEVNLEATPKEVTLDIENDENEKKFITEMSELGFPIINK